MTEIEELKQQLDKCKKDSAELYKQEDELEKRIIKLNYLEIINSGILKNKIWKYKSDYCRYENYVSFITADHYWDELEQFINEGYHYRVPIVNGELYITGDDGEICIHINGRYLDKWLTKIQPVIDKDAIIEEIDNLNEEIDKKIKYKAHLIDMMAKFGMK